MPNRYLRDAILTSERYLALSKTERLLFIELLLCADDFGVVPMGFAFLSRRTTACDGEPREAVLRMLSHLADNDLVRPFDDSKLGWIPRSGFRVRTYKTKYKLPETPGAAFNELIELAQKRRTSARRMLAGDGRTTDKCLPTSTSTSTLNTKTGEEPACGYVDKSTARSAASRASRAPRESGKSKTALPGGWWKTEKGIEKAGTSLGMNPSVGETYTEFKERIFQFLQEKDAR